MLPRELRLQSSDIQILRKAGIHLSIDSIHLIFLKSIDKQSRFAIQTFAKGIPLSVRRNRMKRLFRVALLQERHTPLYPIHAMILVKKEPVHTTQSDINHIVHALFTRIR